MKALAKRVLPSRFWDALRVLAGRAAAGPVAVPAAAPSISPLAPYEGPWEQMGRVYSDDEVVGSGDFDLIGRLELGVLLAEGLQPTDTLLDFGCGTGRLAVHVIPRLVGGRYVGTDISQAMLDKAQQRLARAIPRPPCEVLWIKQCETRFPLGDASVDMVSAFSVFTHMEHEDTFRYLTDARRVVRPAGKVVFSCLPLHLGLARQVFVASARHGVRDRWAATRDVVTSVELMNALVGLAGWEPVRWYDGDERAIPLPDSGERRALGQSVCVLRRAREA